MHVRTGLLGLLCATVVAALTAGEAGAGSRGWINKAIEFAERCGYAGSQARSEIPIDGTGIGRPRR